MTTDLFTLELTGKGKMYIKFEGERLFKALVSPENSLHPDEIEAGDEPVWGAPEIVEEAVVALNESFAV